MIKLIAVDMDGTFLDNKKEYDRVRFNKLYEKMKKENIKFVVASGNQYYQIRSFFEPFRNELSFVAENGSLVVDQGEELYCAQIAKADLDFVIDYLAQFKEIKYIYCGRKSAYLLRENADLYDHMNLYYHKLEIVDDFKTVDDIIFKFALSLPEDRLAEIQALLGPAIGHIVHAQQCGHGEIDLNAIGVNKAVGVKRIQDRYNIKDEECMAFGDSGNDLEMLKHVGHGYAMANASKLIMDATTLRAPSNDEDGVLEIIEAYLETL